MHVVLFYFIVFLKMKLYIGSSYFESVLFFNFFFFSFIISFFWNIIYLIMEILKLMLNQNIEN